MKNFILMLLVGLLFVPSSVLAAPSIEKLQEQIAEIAEQLEELEDRMDPVERKTALDRIQWYGDIRTKVDSLHYQNTAWNPGVYVDIAQFGADAGAGTFGSGAPGTPLGVFMAANPNFAAAFMGGQLRPIEGLSMLGLDYQTPPRKSDINNDLLYTTRLRLAMKAKIADNMSFLGRLSMYKNWGDSTGVKVFDSWNSFTMDGTNGGNTTGDFLRVERAMFNWKNIGGTPFYLSIGRRPSTYGAPSNYRENVKRGGTPTGHLVHFNFDGITIGYSIEDLTGLEGSVVRFCYGQGFESEWGNGELFNDSSTANIDDTHLGGFNIDAFNDGDTLVQITAFRAMDVNDGFKGTFAFPDQLVQLFAPTIGQDTQNFPTFNFVTRYTPTTTIGDINLLGVNVSHEFLNGLVLFGSVGMTQLESNGKAGLFGGLGSDHKYVATLVPDMDGDGIDDIVPVATGQVVDDSTQEGYGVYVGMQMEAPLGKMGLEYNYGSEYWSPFTQSQDDLLGSKLATRGHAVEAYYIFEVNPRAFIKVGGIYYDYEYTGSGSPVGGPKKVDDVLAGKEFSLLPVVDTAWDAYAQATMRW